MSAPFDATPLGLRDLCPLLQVFDMGESLAFYRDIIGFEIVLAAPEPTGPGSANLNWVYLRHGGATLMLNTRYDPDAVRPPHRDPVQVAAHDDTALYIACDDVDAAYEHLRARGVAMAPPRVAPYGMKQLYLKDPDGFSVCFQCPVS
jgi:glyoxylase I family protein